MRGTPPAGTHRNPIRSLAIVLVDTKRLQEDREGVARGVMFTQELDCSVMTGTLAASPLLVSSLSVRFLLPLQA